MGINWLLKGLGCNLEDNFYLSEEEDHRKAILIELTTENLMAVGQNLMYFIIGIIGFDCLTQEVPASLFLFSPPWLQHRCQKQTRIHKFLCSVMLV